MGEKAHILLKIASCVLKKAHIGQKNVYIEQKRYQKDPLDPTVPTPLDNASC